MSVSSAATSNAIGTGVVVVFALLVLPKPSDYDRPTVSVVNLGMALAYFVGAFASACGGGRRTTEGGDSAPSAWLTAGLDPSERHRAHLLRAPRRIMGIQLWLWGIATCCSRPSTSSSVRCWRTASA